MFLCYLSVAALTFLSLCPFILQSYKKAIDEVSYTRVPSAFPLYPYLSLTAPLFPLWHGEVSQDDDVYFSSRVWSRRGHDLACVPLHMYLTGASGRSSVRVHAFDMRVSIT